MLKWVSEWKFRILSLPLDATATSDDEYPVQFKKLNHAIRLLKKKSNKRCYLQHRAVPNLDTPPANIMVLNPSTTIAKYFSRPMYCIFWVNIHHQQ